MFQGRSQGPWPNPMRSNGPFMQQQQPNFQTMPQKNRALFQQMPMQPQMNRQLRTNRPFQQQPDNKGGFLGKLLGKSKQNPQNLFAPPSGIKQETRSGGGILETLKNPDGLSSMLNNTQRVLQAAEQFTPMIQQYGPIVKNLPSIWKIMRAFNSSDNEKEETKKEETKKDGTVKKTTTEKQPDIALEKKTKQSVKKKKSESVPKLYI